MEVISTINISCNHLIQWPQGDHMRHVMLDYKSFYGMPSMHEAIDYTYIHILKPVFFGGLLLFKNTWYSIVEQAVVDAKINFVAFMLVSMVL
jgi:hypothetical protein